MSEVISFKVSKELKEKYEKLKDVIDWPAELRAFVEERVRRAERSLVIRKILEKRPREVLPRGSVVAVIREDREGD
ncbi:MAG: CopG family transcriptional regulator [Aigarchaeota archaeon]|nr:CopG family transcriptional regulator [Candidatus Wolframiiraptor gerlachensis]